MLEIRNAHDCDRPGILTVASDLPAWFDDHARNVAIPIDIQHQQVFVAVDHNKVLGFISLYVSEGRLNIGWIGVLKEFHRRRIGAKLLLMAEQQAQAMGISELAVMTLGDSVDYEPYEQTRSFYFKNGFVEHQRCQTDNSGCPEELRLVKRL